MVTHRTQTAPESYVEKKRSFFGSRTDVGLVRDHNEDSLLVAPPLYVVADGMGGHAAGEIASEIVVRTLDELAPRSIDVDGLTNAIEAANLNVIKAPKQGIGRSGMGTTCTAAILEDTRLLIAQVGDSRAYLLHKGQLQQLTRDHSLMADLIEAGHITPEQARNHPDRSVITRAMGSDPYMLPDIYELNVADGDRILLCSDGLCGMVYDDDIAAIMRRHPDPQTCADRLVRAAVDAGGCDNVTVIVVDVHSKTGQARTIKRAKRKYRTLAICIALAIVVVFALGAFGAYTYVNNSAYLVAEDGKVSVYCGIPDTFLGMQLSHLEQSTDIPVDQLPPGVANRIKEGMSVASMDEANELLESYRTDIARNELAAMSAGQTGQANQTGQTGQSGQTNQAGQTGQTGQGSQGGDR